MTAKRTKVFRRKAVRRAMKIGLPRTESGRLSRSDWRYKAEKEMNDAERKLWETENMKTVVDARQRLYSLTKHDASGVLSGSSLGRLYLRGLITEAQYKAGDRFCALVEDYHRLTGIPHPSPRAQDYRRVHGGRGDDTSEEAVDSAKAAANRYARSLMAIGQIDRAGRPIEQLVRRSVVLDEPTESWTPHMIWLFKLGLDALDRWFVGQAPISGRVNIP